jgi:hypothetical protein
MKSSVRSGQSQLLIPLIIILGSVLALAANTTINAINSTSNSSNTSITGNLLGIPQTVEQSFPIEVWANTSLELETGKNLVRATLILDNGTLLESKQIDFFLNDTMLGSGLTNAEGFVDFPITDNGTLKAVFNGDSYLNPSENETGMMTKKVAEDLEQGEAEIGKPVRWTMRFSFKNNIQSDALKSVPKKAFNVSTTEEDTSKGKKYVVEYFTDAPQAYENIINKYKKTVTVSSDIGYTNIKTYTSIEDAPRSSIRLFWLKDNKRIDVTNDPSINLTLVDTDGNGLIDRLEWITPHTSNQTFEVDIIILNPYTYLRNNDNWTVAFNTTGQADLVIDSTNAAWTEFLTDNLSTYDEMKFLDIGCGNTSLKSSLELIDGNENYYDYSQLTESNSIRVKKLLIRNYSCDYTGYITNNMLKAGYAILQFSFGGQTAYARDPDFTPCQTNITWTSNYTYNITSNNTYYCLNQSWFITSVNATNFTNIQNSTLDCLGYSITGNQTAATYGTLLASSSFNNTVKNCNLTNFTNGIYITGGSNNNTIFNNVLSNESGYGIYQNNSNSTNFTNNIDDYNSGGINLLGTSCNNILINNTFNGLGSTTYGVRIVGHNNTLINNTANWNKYDFYIVGNYNTFINNTAKPSGGSFQWVVTLIGSTYNNFTNNNFIGGSASTDYLFYVSSSNYTSVTGGSIYNASGSSGAEYEIGTASVGNNFTNTNFTGSRKIRFDDAIDLFNYQNDSTQDLWLDTNVSAATTLTRSLKNWNRINMSWNESSSASTLVNYSISGLRTNANYSVYNGTVALYTGATALNASTCGCINFTISFDSTARIMVVNTTDSIPPTYSSNSTNTTVAGQPTLFSLNWADDALAGYIFQFCNGTWNGTFCLGLSEIFMHLPLGGWSNTTGSSSYITDINRAWDEDNVQYNDTMFFANMTSASTGANGYVTFTINHTGISLGYYVFYTWNESGATAPQSNLTILNFTSGSYDTINSTNGAFNWSTKSYNISSSDYINNGGVSLRFTLSQLGGSTGTAELDIGDIYIHRGNTSYWTNSSWSNFGGSTNAWSNVSKTVNSTIGANMSWCVYANDTSNNWNGTSCVNPFKYITINPSTTSSCMIINAPGTVSLTADINSATTPCIDIQTTNVTLDCQGHNINYTGSPGGGTAIQHYTPTSDINSYDTIKNCNITNYQYGIYFGDSISGHCASYNNFTNISSNSELTTFGKNESFSYINTSSSVIGFQINGGGCGAGNNTLLNIIASNHSSSGISIIDGFERLENITVRNSGAGINVGQQSNSLKNVIAVNNTYGIYITSANNNVTNLTATNNTYGVYIDSNNEIIANSTIANNTYGINITSGRSGNIIYNNLLNQTNNVGFAGTISTNYWNTTNQAGTRILYSANYSNIGGNYWTNSTNNGYSDTCTDSNHDGFCDNAYNVTTGTSCTPGVDCGPDVDYLPLARPDTTSPTYTNNVSSTVNTYLSTNYSNFSITWSDDSDSISGAYLENNFSGSLTNTSMSGSYANGYYYNSSVLGANTYQYRFVANDSSNNTNATPILTFTINKATNPVNLYLNGSLNQNRTATYPDSFNATGTSSGGTVNLYRSNASVTNPEHVLLGNGTYEYRVNATGNENYSDNTTSIAFYALVNKGNVFSYIKVYIDGAEANKTINYPTTANASASETASGDSDCTYTLNRNGTALIPGSNVWNVTTLGNDTWMFNYSMSGTCTNWTLNTSQNLFLYVNKGTPTVTLYLNGSQGSQTSTYPNSTINVTATSSDSVLYVQLWRNDTLLDNVTSTSWNITQWPAWNNNFSAKVVGNANYTDSALVMYWWNVSKGSNPVLLYLNNTLNTNRTTTYPDSFNATGNVTYGSTSLYRDNVSVTNPEIVLLGNGTYEYRVNTTGNANYSSNGTAFYAMVNKGSVTATLYLNGSTSDVATSTYPNSTINATATSSVSGLYVQIWRTNASMILLDNETSLSWNITKWGAFINNFSAKVVGNANYTDSALVTLWWNVSKASTTTTLYLNDTQGDKSYNQGNTSNFTVSLSVSNKNVNLTSNYTGWSLQTLQTPLYNYTTLNTMGRSWNLTGYFAGDENYTASLQTYYFNVTSTSFVVAVPNDSSTYSADSGNSTPDENINSTTASDKNVNPCVRGTAICQTSSVANFRVNNTGNVNENITMCINATLPSSMTLFGTNTSNSYLNAQLIPACSSGLWIANSSLVPNASANFWIWTNFTGASTIDSTAKELYINSTESGA